MIRSYGVPRDEIVDSLVDLLGRANLDVIGVDKALVGRSLLLCRGSGRVSLADALIHAEACQHTLPVYTFDQRFPGGDIVVRHPGGMP